MKLKNILDFSKAFIIALADSTRVDQLLIGEEISSVGRMKALLFEMEASDEGRAILQDLPRLCSETLDIEALRALPEETLGHAYVRHLERNQLSQDALAVPVTRGDTPLENYLLERVRQTHDIWHTLLGLGVQGHEEVLVHAFQWSQLRMPYSALVVVFGTFKHVIGEHRWRVLRGSLRAAYAAGKAASPLLPIYWERHWQEPLSDMRARFHIRTLTTLA